MSALGCPRCGAEGSLDSEPRTEAVYGYGGYTGEYEVVGVRVYCRASGCPYEREYGLYELGELAVVDAGASV